MKHNIPEIDFTSLFDAIRFDWEEAYSSLLAENFVIHLN
jgi:hypothetical protein